MADKQRENNEDEEKQKKQQTAANRHVSFQDNENLNDMLIQKIAKNGRERDRKLRIWNNHSPLD